MSKILIVYGTNHGQTEKIAKYIARAFDPTKHSVELFNSANMLQSHNPAYYDAIIAGAPVYTSRYQKKLTKWVKNNAPILNKKKSAFFSVCLGILQKDDRVQKEEWKFVHDFLSENQWDPQMREIFAGSLTYSKYNFITKYVMKRISKKEGRDTDTSRDYEYTNWDQVSKFTAEFSKLLDVDVVEKQKTSAEIPSAAS